MIEYFSKNCTALLVYKKNNYIYKIYRNTNAGLGRFKNELFFLNNFNTYSHFPNLLGYDNNKLTIIMSFCGKHLNNKNIPDNWMDQIIEINNILKIYRIELVDLQYKNILCNNGIIYLIDFDNYNILKEYNNNNLNRLISIFKNL